MYAFVRIDIRKGLLLLISVGGLPTDVSHMSGGRFIIPTTHPGNKPVAEFVDNNFALDRKIMEAFGDVPKSTQWLLMKLPRDEDKELIADLSLTRQMKAVMACRCHQTQRLLMFLRWSILLAIIIIKNHLRK